MKTLPFRSLLHQFAAKHRLKVVTDKDDGTSIIRGQTGHVYEFDEHCLGVMYLSTNVAKTNNRRKACEAVGMEVVQDGDTEFAVVFGPDNPKQAALAIRVAGCKRRRILSAEQRKKAGDRLRTYRGGVTLTKSGLQATEEERLGV